MLTEYIPSDPVALSVAERDALRGLVPGLTIEPIPGSTDTYTLTGGSSVGVVRVGELTVELRPKIGIAPVLFLLSYALDAKAWREPPAELVRDANLAEAIVPLFVRAAQAALRPGLLHGYRPQDDTLVTVRGRVRMAEQMRARTGLPMPVEVRYDEFTPDILENRLLRTAVDVLGRLRLRHRAPRIALARLRQQFNGIGGLVVDRRDVPEPTWTRLNERYRPAVALARLILSGAGLEGRAGGQDASALVVDMNTVFERFIRVALREALQLDAKAFPAAGCGHRIHLDVGRSIPLEPDLSWWIAGRCVFAGDCKYKRTTGTVPNADVYQMLAYLTALRLPEGLLIYAAGENAPPDLRIEHVDKRIHVRIIDVAQPPAVVIANVRTLSALVHGMAHSRPSSVSPGA
ncbi:McrC family protein [Geodermatophilus sabuli]|uniref:McrC family protein n=1 Tax=Geodermatophilus sabuli TaxID=1564158 RepID=UPI001559D47F|nr:restriction endonuclease [Geodermatophilus sabuli]MBB3084222.1 5-methylcytosine-specific restriction enzyme subunit McrC [Geodermatophilus sabuli]